MTAAKMPETSAAATATYDNEVDDINGGVIIGATKAATATKGTTGLQAEWAIQVLFCSRLIRPFLS